MDKRIMSLEDACALVPDDLPDGAYWAMAHEIAGANFGEVWDELKSSPTHKPFKAKAEKTFKCGQCSRKFESLGTMKQHEAAMVRNGTHERVLTNAMEGK